MNVVVVESPTKAKTINKYLGPDYQVLSSYGHVRDLPEKEGSVRPDDDFAMTYEVMADKKARVNDIAKALKGAKRLYLATDPDREGEAISWHLLAALGEKRALGGIEVKRVVFHEVTKQAVLQAMAHPRDLFEDLIDAYQARRALDYLVGFTLSPVLWRKLPGARSAGRVQSVALRLICEREDEIDRFVAREYWTVEADLETMDGAPFRARLTHLDGKKLDKFALGDQGAGHAAKAKVERAELSISGVEKKQGTRNPAPPFSTSTLQQEAARKLGFGADRTMRTAQRLFEGVTLGGETVGLITYMRTDSVQLSKGALGQARDVIRDQYGERYLPEHPRQFKTKTKNAQEAHEAIRPTDLGRRPEQVAAFIDQDQLRLYELIWKRTIASQMAAALLDRVAVTLAGEGVALRATGQTIAFEGFIKVYREGIDDAPSDKGADDDSDRLLPPMREGDPARTLAVHADQHFTEPPPRYTEASLVKRMEELGIGRPSTYASIISVLQNRSYVRLEAKRFIPEDRGRVVSTFLTQFFERYVEYDFTAQLENQLDAVAAGELDWKQVLRQFWDPFYNQTEDVKGRRNAEIIDALDAALGPHLFPPKADGADPRQCPSCAGGRLSLKFGKFGGFVGCSNYPECRFTRQLGEQASDGDAQAVKERLLGIDAELEEEVWLKVGRFGPYIQRGSGDALKRSSLPPNLRPADVDLDIALQLLALPRDVGTDPESGEAIVAGINRYGPFVQRGRSYVRLDADDDVLSIGMNRALTLLAEKGKKGGGRQAAASTSAKVVGEHPDDGKPIQLLAGRFGPYLKWNKLNASLPKSADPEALTLDEAVGILAAKAAKNGGKVPAKPAKKAKTTKAATPKAATAKKAAGTAKKSGS
ncbi:MAG: type I DNA topoisomerase [Geminicoccaceae bacterium]|nr:MAG: type I DNA topoisomerase [Geminicoccaceae bacterium]